MVKRKIIVSERDNIATLFEDDRAIEFVIHRGDMLLGDVYLATVENILPSIDAAFVHVGGDKMGFLHSSDVKGKGDLQVRLQPKQQLVVQVMKEPTGHKGPRVTTNISLPGRFLVLMPESKGISISRKIEQSSERSRLKSIVSLIKPPGVGVIIRTEANLQTESDIQEDFETLMERWQNIVAMADNSTPPTLLYRDQDLLYRVIREVVTDDVSEIIVDTQFGQQRAQQLLQNWNMEKGIKVTLYNGAQSILVSTGVDREIKLALQTKVPLPSGGYLYIQPTEALTVVDVNSGKFTSLQSQAETIRLTNLEACKEIARQLRLRNVGGMIIVDFIDMESRADKLAILEAFENELTPDKAKPQIGQLSDLGLVEMTRHRQGQSLNEIFTKKCVACYGTGHAMEEFNWAPANLDSADGRAMMFGRSGRSNMPMRQQGRNQGRGQQARPQGFAPGTNAASPAHTSRQHANAPMPVSPVSLSKVLQTGRPAQAGTTVQEAPAIGSLYLSRTTASPTQKDRPMDGRALDEHFKEKLFRQFGLRYANIVKLSHTPPMANSILSRINPKSNDIITLVLSIEGSAIMPISEIEAESDEMETEEETEEEAMVMARASVSGARETIAENRQENRPQVRLENAKDEYVSLDEDEDDSETSSEELRSQREDVEDEELVAEDAHFVGISHTGYEIPGLLLDDLEDISEKPKRRRGRPPKRLKATEPSPLAQQQDDPESAGGGPGKRARKPATALTHPPEA